MILTRDEERNLPRALASLPEGMPVQVVDSGSTDRTREIAAAGGASVLVHEFNGFVSQRRFAVAQVKTPWALMIDADEALDERLRAAILAAPEDANGYLVERTTYYCGKPLRMWSGERLLRLFRRDRAHLEAMPAAGGEAELHERWVCEGPLGTLDGTLLHYSYPDRAAYQAKYARYTDAEAAGLKPSAGRLVLEVLRAYPRFFWYMLRRRALFDGMAGLRVAWWSAWYPAVVQWKALRGRSGDLNARPN